MPEAPTAPAAPAATPLASGDTVLRGIPALKKLPPVVQYLLVMLLTALGGYFGQGVHGVSASDAQNRDSVIIEKLERIETGQDALEKGQHDLDRRLVRIEAKREAEREGDGG